MEDVTTKEDRLQPDRIKTVVCFFIFGLLSMVVTQIIFTATQDILTGSQIASSTVILAASACNMSVKAICPWFVQNCSYMMRTAIFALLNSGGLVIIILVSDVHWRLVGVAVACAAGALGEMTFIALTSFYNKLSGSAFAAGTGMSSLLGPYLYTGGYQL